MMLLYGSVMPPEAKSNKTLRFAFSSISISREYAEPINGKFDKNIDIVNDYLCTSSSLHINLFTYSKSRPQNLLLGVLFQSTTWEVLCCHLRTPQNRILLSIALNLAQQKLTDVRNVFGNNSSCPGFCSLIFSQALPQRCKFFVRYAIRFIILLSQCPQTPFKKNACHGVTSGEQNEDGCEPQGELLFYFKKLPMPLLK